MKKKNLDENASLSMGERILYGFGGFGNATVNAIVTGFLMYFYTTVMHVNGGVVGVIFLIAKFLDAFADLIVGHLVDLTHTKKGQARPWLLWMALPYAISGILLFLLQGSWPQIVQYIYIFITYTLCGTVFFTCVTTPYNSMNALVTKNQYERGLLGSFNVIGNLVSQIVVNTFMLRLISYFGNTQSAWISATAVFAVLGFLAHMLCYKNTIERASQNNTNEKKSEDSPTFIESFKSLIHNKYWIMITAAAAFLFLMNTLQLSGAVYFAKGIIHNANAVSGLTNSMNITQMIIIIFSFIYIKKLGKGNSFKVGYALVTLTYVAQIFVGGNYIALIVLGAVRGLGMGMGSAVMAGILSDTVEYGEWKTGVRSVGMANAANSFCQKIGQGIGNALIAG